MTSVSERYSGILAWFRENAPEPRSELVFGSPYELLVAVMLSAQCTDRRVNQTTPALFAAYPCAAALAAASPQEVFGHIKSVSYPNSKSEHLVGMARKVMEDFGGEIPTGIDDLMTLPGVGRKTANVVASILEGAPVIAVDTHVFRVARRIGLSRGSTPLKVEQDLEKHIPEELRPAAHHWLLLHGRYVCTARSPKCADCPVAQWCKSFGAGK